MSSRFVCRAVAVALVVGVLALFDAPESSFAQQGLTTGAINGQVTDNTGAPLEGATVIVRNPDTGFTRQVQTSGDGRYVAGLLPPGQYSVTAQFPPLEAIEMGPYRISVGDERVVDVALQPLEAAGIAVTIQREQVDVTEGGVITLIDEEQLDNLPTLGRDFTDFINLSGLVSVTPEVTTGGQFSLGGGRTSATNVQIDGVDANNAFFGENRGSSRIPFTFSLESIKEFQIITNGFDVEYGNYTGGVVNAVTKGGTNEFHGSAFGYFRDQALTANDFSGLEAEDFSVQQFGVSLEGPIVRDKAHFLLSFDGQQKEQPVFSIVPERWCPPGTDAGGEPLCVGAADSIARFKNILHEVYGVSLEELEANIGTFQETEDEIAVFGRVDWQLNDRHALILRHNYTNLESLNDRLSDEEARTYGSTFKNESNSFVSELTSVFGERGQAFNNFRFQWSEEDRPRPANNFLPEIDVNIHQDATDVEYFGDGIVFRNRLEESKFQFVDNLTWQLGEEARHTIKVGTNNVFSNIQNLFHLLGTGNYNFDSLADLEAKNVDSYTRFVREDGGSPFADFDISEYAIYAQDEWQVSDQLLLALGLRYDTNTFGDPAIVAPELIEGFGLDTSVVPEDRNNISPRVAFTYDLRGDETAIVRGGVGLLYGRLPFVLHGNVMQSSPALRNLFCPGSVAPEPDYDFFRQTPDGSNNPSACTDPDREGDPPEFAVWDPDMENPESWRFNLGYEAIVGDGWRVAVDGLYSRTEKNFNVNQINLNDEMFRTAVDDRPVFVPASAFFRNNFNFRTEPRANTDFAGVYFNESTAESEAWSLDLKVGRRWEAIGLRTDASYTFNNVMDNSSFFCCTSNEGFRIKPTAGDPNFIGDPGDDEVGTWGHADFERQHVFILSGTFEGPWGIDVSGIWRSQSGTPWTPVVDGDINGDGEEFNDRAPVFEDLLFETPEDAAAFQALLDEDSEAGECLRENLGRIAERNSCRNPWFHSVDVHLSKSFAVMTGHEIELIADMFNVLNGLNEDWGQFNAVFGSATNVFNKEGYDQETNRVIYSVLNQFGREAALGFNPLQFQAQLGVRYRF